jgi:class 3 adenylate cyclase
MGAAAELRTGIRLWREVGSPYEVARARATLSRALRAVDDDDDADLELQAALDAFRRLGARVDLEAGEREEREAADRRHGPQTARMTFMFTDIVGSTNLAERLGDLAWEQLLRWHDDMLRLLIERGGGEIVKTTGDGVFAAFPTARAGVDAAIAIQRSLAQHRAFSGVALAVRIGLHTAEATRRGADYSGMAVHVAARIGALAQGGEILASAETLTEAGRVPASAPRVEAVRGVTVPVTVAAVDWA